MAVSGGDLGRAVFELATDDSKLDSGFAGAEKKARGLGGGIESALKVGALAGGAAIVGGLAMAVSAAAEFEQSLADTAAATGATKEQMAGMRQEALGIGKDTSKGASDAALAMGELVKAGVPVETVINGAARAAVQLSEATGIDVPAAANLMSKAMNTFTAEGLTAEQAATLFAKASNASAIGVTDMAFSLAAVGPVASQAGLTMEDFATSIGILGNHALVGSDAGTSLKTMLMSLEAPTAKSKNLMKELGISVFDANGNMLPFRDIIGSLQVALGGASDAQKAAALSTIFGSDAIRAANILMDEGTAGWDKFKASMAGAPSLAEQSATKMATLKGQIEMLKGSIETIAITIGSVLLPVLTDLATKGSAALAWLMEQDWDSIVADIRTEFEKWKPTIDAVIEGATTLAPKVLELFKKAAELTEQIIKLSGVFKDNKTDGDSLGESVDANAKRMDTLFTSVGTVVDILTKILDIGTKVTTWMNEHKVVADAVAAAYKATFGQGQILLEVLGWLFDRIGEVSGTITTMKAKLDEAAGAFGAAKAKADELIATMQSVWNWLSKPFSVSISWPQPPSWFWEIIPHSPPPFAQGIAMVGDAARRATPDLSKFLSPDVANLALLTGGAHGGDSVSDSMRRGGGLTIDYDRLAAAIARNPLRVDMDGRELMQRLRPHGYNIRQSTGTLFGE